MVVLYSMVNNSTMGSQQYVSERAQAFNISRDVTTSEQSQDKQCISNVIVTTVILQKKQKQREAHLIQVPQPLVNAGRQNLLAPKQIVSFVNTSLHTKVRGTEVHSVVVKGAQQTLR